MSAGRNFDFAGYSINLATEPDHAVLVAQSYARLKAAAPGWR